MLFLIVKYAVTGLVIVVVSEVAKRSDRAGAIASPRDGSRNAPRTCSRASDFRPGAQGPSSKQPKPNKAGGGPELAFHINPEIGGRDRAGSGIEVKP